MCAMTGLKCAFCNAALEPLAAWKGSGDDFFCNDFCAEAEGMTDEASPSIVPTAGEDLRENAMR
jgi:hypothetical protein